MNPPTTSRNTNPAAGHYVPGRPVGVVGGVGAGGGGGGGGGLYLNAYEVSFPYEESLDRTPAFHVNQSQHMMEEPMVMEPPPQYSTFMLISNLRTHLYVSLEKNAWLQKRIEELEEERNFLRCQMSCFISNMRGQEVDLQHAVAVKEQPASSPSPPSPMTTRSGMTLKRRALPRSRRSSTATVKQEYHMEEEKYYAEEEYMEEEETVDEEEEDSSVEKRQRKKGRGPKEPKMRRVFRITHGRERQRVKDPDGVLMRYKKILTTYQRVRSMSRAFQAHGVDRNTMASTSPIAELMLVAPEKLVEVGEFEAPKEKLLDYARRCYKAMDEQTHLHVQAMKKTHKLLPISYRFRN